MIGLLLTLTDGATVPAVTDYTLDGPSTATTGIASDAFTVTLGAGTLADPVVVTPDDGAAGGTFSVATVTLADGSRLATFTYTAAAAGSVTISVTNDGGLTDPDPIVLTVSDALPPDVFARSPIVMLRPAPTRWYRRV